LSKNPNFFQVKSSLPFIQPMNDSKIHFSLKEKIEIKSKKIE
jgi:hypothetical protein